MISKRGTIQLYIAGMILALVVLFYVAVLSPMGVLVNTEFTKATTDIRAQFLPQMNLIENESIRNSIIGSMDSAVTNSENMVEINAFAYKWGWLFVILIPFIAMFIYSRMNVEMKNTGGLV